MMKRQFRLIGLVALVVLSACNSKSKDANFPLLYCEKGLLDFDLSSDIAMNEKAQIQQIGRAHV